jgi:nucleoside-diphosphate-sugar epimerase
MATHRAAVADVVPGDMVDPAAVATALDGCDAVVHAAAQIGVSGGTESGPEANVKGVRHVVGQAVERGCDPIVYTSTFTVHLPTEESLIGPDSPFAEPMSVYGRSKAECEHLVAEWQAQDAPITTFVLGGVYGPESPHTEGSAGALLSVLTSMAVETEGGVPLIDVRDVAAALTAALRPGRGPHRYMAGGTFLTWTEYSDLLAQVVGRDLPRHRMSAEEMIAMGRDLDRRRAEGHRIDLPLSEEAAVIMTAGRPTDDRVTWDELGVRLRPPVDTLRDAVRSLVDQGHLDPASAPALAPTATIRRRE